MSFCFSEQAYTNTASFEASNLLPTDNGSVNDNMVENSQYQNKSLISFFKSITSGYNRGVKRFFSSLISHVNSDKVIEVNEEALQEVSKNNFEETILVNDNASLHTANNVEGKPQNRRNDHMEIIGSDYLESKVSTTPSNSSIDISDYSSKVQPLSSSMPTRIKNRCLDSFYWDCSSVKWICLVMVNQRLSPQNSVQRFFNHFSYPEAVHVVMLSRHSLLSFPNNNDVSIKDVLDCLKEAFTVKGVLFTVEDSMEIEALTVKYPFSLKVRFQSHLLSYFSQTLTAAMNSACIQDATKRINLLHTQSSTKPVNDLKNDKKNEPQRKRNTRFIHLSFASEVTRKQITMVVDKLLLEKVHNLKSNDEVKAFKKRRGEYLKVTRLCTYAHPFAFRINISNSNMKKLYGVLQQEIPQIFKDNKCLIRIISHYNPENGRDLSPPK